MTSQSTENQYRPRVRIHSGFAKTSNQPTNQNATAGVPSRESDVRQIAATKNRAVRLLDVAEFASEFRALVGAGLPLGESLGVIATSMKRRCPRLSSALLDIRERVEQGKRLGEAFGHHRTVFGDLAVEMIAAGEQTGRLDQYLGDLADAYEQRHQNRATVLSALIEPALVVFVGIGVVYLILTLTVPRMKELYDSIGKNSILPLPTRILMWTADFLTSLPGILAVAGVILLGIGSWIVIQRSDRVRFAVHSFLLRLPLLGELVQKDSIARGCRTLAVSVRTIGDVPSGLVLAGRTSGNLKIGQAFSAAADSVRSGRAIHTSLDEAGDFPEVCIWMIRTGERSGTLDTMLVKIAEGFESHVKFARERLLTFLKPALVVVMGGLVLLIMLALYLPIFQLIENLKR